MRDGGQNLSSLHHAYAGAISGFVTRFCCQPLDVLKIIFQLQSDPKDSSKYRSVTQAVKLIVKEEGIQGLWRGHIPAQYLSIIFGAVQFSTNEKLLDMSKQIRTSGYLTDTFTHFCAGGASGVVAITISFPFDTIRTRLVAQTKSKLYKGVFDAAKKIWIHEGGKGFFNGLLPALMHITPSSGLVFGFKHIYQEIWDKYQFLFSINSTESVQMSIKGHAVTGLLAGITSKALIHPLDLIKKRLQIQGMDEDSICLNKKLTCNGLLHCIKLICKNEGLLGLYKGIFPAILKAGFASAINFTVYNEVCHLMKFIDR